MIKVLPILWKGEAGGLVPMDESLHAAAVEFTRKEFGDPNDLKNYFKTWVVCEVNGNVLKKVTGIMGLTTRIDVPLFHVEAPDTNDPYAIKDFSRAYRALFNRGKEFLNDQGTTGQFIFVHFSEESKNAAMLKHAFRELDAKPSNRVLVEV